MASDNGSEKSARGLCLHCKRHPGYSRGLCQVCWRTKSIRKQYPRLQTCQLKFDMTGKKFGYLTVRGPEKRQHCGKLVTFWRCDCECGGTVLAAGGALRGDKRVSCGNCLRKPRVLMRPGVKYGLLTIIRMVKETDSKWARRIWLCECECGGTTLMRGKDLRRVIRPSCGCLKPANSGYGEISGGYWARVLAGADGSLRREIEVAVTIEDAWNLFLAQDRKCALTGAPLSFDRDYRRNGKRQTASLDRIDSNKGYTKGNIQWVHKIINRLKNKFSQEEFVRWCKLVARHARRVRE
jgi:hypothetical protein